MNQFLTIELFGHPFTFKTEADVSMAKEIADFLVKEVAKVEVQLSNKSSNITKHAILILTALNIANEYFELKKSYANLLENISKRSAGLIRELDASVQ